MSLSSAFLFLLSTQLIACIGTEVGNGRSGPKPPAAVGGSKSPDVDSGKPDKTAPENVGNPGTTSPDGGGGDPGPLLGKLSTRLFASCGSPFAEGIAASFVASPTGDNLISTAAAALGSWSITLGNEQVQVTPAATADQPYAVTSTVSGTQPSCSSSSKQGATRTVTFTDGFQTKWTVDAQNKVKTIELLDSDGTVLNTYARP